MVTVEPHREGYLDELQRLINCHLDRVVAGWRLPAEVIAGSLEPPSDDHGPDPWVTDRHTLCALEDDRLVGAAHVVRYGPGPEVGSGYRDAAELAWLLFWPEAQAAAQPLVGAARDQVAEWGASHLYACDTSLPVPVISGVPESWPHVSAALLRSGFRPLPAYESVIYGGRLPDPGDDDPPIPGLQMRAAADEPGHRFLAELGGAEVGFLDWTPDLSFGGTLPALAGWAHLTSVAVREEWRGRGIGPWLVRRTVPFLRMVGARRVVAAMTAAEEAAGSGAMCRRLGWDRLVRLEQGWSDVP